MLSKFEPLSAPISKISAILAWRRQSGRPSAMPSHRASIISLFPPSLPPPPTPPLRVVLREVIDEPLRRIAMAGRAGAAKQVLALISEIGAKSLKLRA